MQAEPYLPPNPMRRPLTIQPNTSIPPVYSLGGSNI